MPSPISPSDLKETIPAPGGNVCEKVAKNLLRRFPEMVYAIFSYERDENGDLSDDFKADVCALECFCGGVVKPPIDTTLGTPVISATDGSFSDKVRVTWGAIDGATKYYIFRNTTDTTPLLNTTPLAVVNSPTLLYDDTSAVPGQVYYYWVRAASPTEISNLSNSNSGYAENASTNEVRFENPGVSTWVVPDGVTTIDVRLISAGASGGGGAAVAGGFQGRGGGGGGGGGYTELLNISVTPGETLNIEVGAGGVHPGIGHSGSQSAGVAGVSGGDSKLKRSSTVLASSSGGVSGGVASTTPGTGGAGGAGVSSNGSAGQDGVQVSFSQGYGGPGGAAGTALYAQKGYGGSGQSVVGRPGQGGEGGGGQGGAPVLYGPPPTSGKDGIVVIFY